MSEWLRAAVDADEEVGPEALVEDLLARLGETVVVLREFLDWYDARFPSGQSKQLPGLPLFCIAEKARAALEPEDGS